MRTHGTHACYVFGPEAGRGPGCRCEPCRDANRAYEAERAQRIAPTLTDAGPVRDHVRHLMASGVGLKTIIARSGVGSGTMWKLVYGKDGRPTERVRLDTADKILAVNATMAADGARIPAERTWRNVDELLRRGWTKVAIARAIGQKGTGLQLGRSYVTAAHARRIAGLLDQPVPPRNLGRAGYVESTWDAEAEARAAAHRAAQAEERREYRARRRMLDAMAEGQVVDYELPTLAAGGGAWMTRGACRLPNVPTWPFFAEEGDRKAIAAAKRICASCPVQGECYEAGRDEQGIWGGMTESERRRARKVAS